MGVIGSVRHENTTSVRREHQAESSRFHQGSQTSRSRHVTKLELPASLTSVVGWSGVLGSPMLHR
jgi:hypothetical protein